MKRCIRCKRNLREVNKTNYCRHCYIYITHRNRIKNHLKNHRCIDCGKKLRPIKIYRTRCKKHLLNAKRWRDENKKPKSL